MPKTKLTPKSRSKGKKTKKENKQIVEIHIYIHQEPSVPNSQPSYFPQTANPTPWNPPYTVSNVGLK